jgi:methyl-accepting chemotaxis protein
MFNFSNMTMLRQLRLAIVLSMMLALSGALLASLLSARGYLESQLSIKNTDNANALALSLSQNNPDEVMVELLVASLFDGGHYELVRITDPQGKPIAQREDTAQAHDAPAWFARLLPIEAQPGVAQINKGWQQFGQITVVSHSRFAYGALWRSATQMTLALSLAGLVGVVLGSRVLKRLSGPLKVVTSQAHAISERRFVTSEVPRVPELQQLASAMNTMVNKINQIFEDQSRDLDKLQVQVNTDAATGLANRSFFMGRMRSATDSADATGGEFDRWAFGPLTRHQRTLRTRGGRCFDS